MKSAFLAVAVSFLVASTAFADTWGITGAAVIKPSTGPMVVIPMDTKSTFFTLAECEAAREENLMFTVKQGVTNSLGTLPSYDKWLPQGNVAVLDFTRCGKTFQY